MAPRDLTKGLVYDRAAFTWVTPEEMAERDFWREEAAFMRASNQGELAAPMVITDKCGSSINGLQSMQNGKFYDSKSALRRHYKEAGVVEVGNDSSLSPEALRNHVAPHKRKKTAAERDAYRRQVNHDVEAAISRVNLTSYRSEEIK